VPFVFTLWAAGASEVVQFHGGSVPLQDNLDGKSYDEYISSKISFNMFSTL
jgi:hypothetical protein